jgi:hypothetical protein
MLDAARPWLCALALAAAGAASGLAAEDQAPCSALMTLTGLRRDLEAFGKEESAWPDARAIRARLDGIDRMTLAGLRNGEGGDHLARLIFFFFELLDTGMDEDRAAARAILRSPEYREASEGLSDLASSLSCRQAGAAPIEPEPAGPAAYDLDFSYFLGHWPAALVAGLACFGIVAGAVWRSLRRTERLGRPSACSVTVHVTSERETCLGTLIEISREGGKVRFAHPPDAGTRLRIQWDAQWHEASVIWSNQFCSGLHFTRLIPAGTIEVLRDLSRQTAGTDDPPPGSGASQETRQDASL